MVVDIDIFEKNLRTMADHCRATGIQLRGHVKVHKSPDIAKRQLALGSIGVTCATVAECELMAHSGVTGILLTRQPTSKNNITRVIALARREPTFETVLDDPLVADWPQEAAAAEGVKLRTAVGCLCRPDAAWHRSLRAPALALARARWTPPRT